MSRNLIFGEGEYYHIYNRGTERRDIFDTPASYDRFLACLFLCNGHVPVVLKTQGATLLNVKDLDRKGTRTDICAYCLMPNHYHIIAREKERGGISHFMQKLSTGHTTYYNKLHERTGVLFQGKFKAKHINSNEYLLYLMAYVHLNPIDLFQPGWKKDGLFDFSAAKAFLSRYKYSSYIDYTGVDRLEKIIIDRDALPGYFQAPADFEDYINDWLTYKNDIAMPANE